MADRAEKNSWGQRMSDELDDLVAAVEPVKVAFEKLGVRFFVGGSVASSWHGATRSTMDIDLVAELSLENVAQFIGLVEQNFYASEAAIREAIERTSCFNLIHNATSFKIDIFVSRNRPFDQDSFARAEQGEIGGRFKLNVPVASAEDIIVSKLEWYRLGEETSERQWEDVSRVLRLLGDAVDGKYLSSAADQVGVLDLWEKLKREMESNF